MIPCGLFELLLLKYKANIPIVTILSILYVILNTICYKWLLNYILYKPYKRIIVTTNFNSITWKIAFLFFIIQIILEISSEVIFNNLLDSIPSWIACIIYLIIDYYIMNYLSERYITIERRTNQ